MINDGKLIYPNDSSRKTTEISALFPHVDFTNLTSEEDPLYEHEIRETGASLDNRAEQLYQWASSRPENHIVIVSHSEYLSHALKMVGGNDGTLDPDQISNCSITGVTLFTQNDIRLDFFFDAATNDLRRPILSPK